MINFQVYSLSGGGGHLENKKCSFLCTKKHGISHEVEYGHPDYVTKRLACKEVV